jgi:6-phosphogluconate dehydrogenase (decarboxylating)
MMQAIAEDSASSGQVGFDLDLYRISDIWQYGSVVRSWL